MKNVLIALVVFAFAIPAFADQNPHLGIYLYTTSTGIGGTNHSVAPAAGGTKNVRVFVDQFGVGGGIKGISFKFDEVNCPDFLSVTNKMGGLTIGTPGAGIAMTAASGTVSYPNANGVVYVAEVKYAGPEELLRADGHIQLVGHPTDGNVAADANNLLDHWCVHSVAYNGLSGNFGWDDGIIPDGDCVEPSAVESTTWGSIKALYR